MRTGGGARASIVRNTLPHVVAVMFRCDFLTLPVHAGRALVVDLHAVYAHIALLCFGISRDDQRPGDETSGILRPTF